MSDGTAMAREVLGLDGFKVLRVTRGPVEVVIEIETTAMVGWSGRGVRAEAQDRTPVHVRDMPCLDRPARLIWNKRRWRYRGVR